MQHINTLKVSRGIFLFLLGASGFVAVNGGGLFCQNPSPPVCADDCEGNGYYLSPDEQTCILCPTCGPGLELNKVCGNGVNGDATCGECGEGTYSTEESRACLACAQCINREVVQSCSSTTNTVCGSCLQGFAQRRGRFVADPEACPDRCADLPPDEPQCLTWWARQLTGQTEDPSSADTAGVEFKPVPIWPLDEPEFCEPSPPGCADDCLGDRYYLGSDGLCKMCLQCMPGQELDKICGNGKNGDAVCRNCPKGSFSVNGKGQCTPCRICDHTEIYVECSATTDRSCGPCLPGYYKESKDFPDPSACPNSCVDCPTDIPQCEDWCEQKARDVAPSNASKPVVLLPVGDRIDDTVDFPNDDTGENNGLEAGADDEISASHPASYMTIIAVLASLIVAMILLFVVALFVIRFFWRQSDSQTSVTGETTQALLSPPNTPCGSSQPSPLQFLPSTLWKSPNGVYNETVYPAPGSESPEFMSFLHQIFHSRDLTKRSNATGSLSDQSSGASTPTLELNRKLRERERESQRDVQQPIYLGPTQRKPHPYDSAKGKPESSVVANGRDTAFQGRPKYLCTDEKTEKTSFKPSDANSKVENQVERHTRPSRAPNTHVIMENEKGNAVPYIPADENSLPRLPVKFPSGMNYIQHRSLSNEDVNVPVQIKRRRSSCISFDDEPGGIRKYSLTEPVRRRSSQSRMEPEKEKEDRDASERVGKGRSTGKQPVPGRRSPEAVAELFPVDSNTTDADGDHCICNNTPGKRPGSPAKEGNQGQAYSPDAVITEPPLSGTKREQSPKVKTTTRPAEGKGDTSLGGPSQESTTTVTITTGGAASTGIKISMLKPDIKTFHVGDEHTHNHHHFEASHTLLNHQQIEGRYGDKDSDEEDEQEGDHLLFQESS